MTLLTLATLAAMSVAPPSHSGVLQHRGMTYLVSYQPQVRVSMKAVGMVAGTRASTERCRWRAEVQVERSVRQDSGSVAQYKLLPGVRRFEGSRPGSCAGQQAAVTAAGERAAAAAVAEHVRRIALADRPALLADIDAAHAIAAAD